MVLIAWLGNRPILDEAAYRELLLCSLKLKAVAGRPLESQAFETATGLVHLEMHGRRTKLAPWSPSQHSASKVVDKSEPPTV